MSHFPIHHGGTPHPRIPGNAALPPSPCSLAQLAPEIADRIAAVWGDVRLTGDLIEQLLVGEATATLPAAVTAELLRLYEYNARCRAHDAPDTTWELPVSRLQPLSPRTTFESSES